MRLLTPTLVLLLLAILAASPASAATRARADFDGDGYADLAVGAPQDSVEGRNRAGAVNVLYGSRRGLTEAGDQQFTQGTPGVVAFPSLGDRLGAALASGDFDADGFADLAIGVPGEDVDGRRNGGIVQVLYGSSGGLTTSRDRYFSQSSRGIPGGTERFENLGWSLAAGDFDGDGDADLAAGLEESVNGRAAAGAVNVIYGSPAGLTAAAAQLWHQGRPGISAEPGAFDRFGFAIASGDVNDDGYSDLAAGVPGERIRGAAEAGAVNVIYGSSRGLAQAGDQLISQGRIGVRGRPDRGDNFGRGLTIGDFNLDGFSDLAAGAPFEDIPAGEEAGAVNVLFGSNRGLTGVADEIWHQNTRGVPGGAERGDRFGVALTAGDLSINGADDLAVAVLGESVSGHPGAGAVNVLYGARRGLKSGSAQIWHQGTRGIHGALENFDRLGRSLAMADFDRDRALDLAIGASGESLGGGRAEAGAVNVIYGSLVGLRRVRDEIWHQGTPGVFGAPGADRFGQALANGRRAG